jgi:transcriptional regulator of arginine metabolism
LKERPARLRIIRKLIKNEHIVSQEELQGFLQKEGLPVTQATLTRDLRLLKVGKVPFGAGASIYTLPAESERLEAASMYVEDFLRGYVSIEWSGNIVVIKTYPSHAGSVAQAVDNLAIDSVLGTVAGADNTVFVCLREGVTGEKFLQSMKEHIPALEE